MTTTKVRPIPKALFSKVEKIANTVGFGVEVSEYENGNFFCFAQHSPEGQDFSFEVEAYTLEELRREIQQYHERYDPSEEAMLWLGDDGHGKNGAPYDMRDLLTDMEWCREKIGELDIKLREVA